MGAGLGTSSLPLPSSQVGPLVQSSQTVPGKLVTLTRLYIPLRMEMDSGYSVEVTALVDTGCEMNLVKVGLIPDNFFHKAPHPVNFVAANKTAVPGGRKELCCTLRLNGVDLDTSLHTSIQLPFTCLDAEVVGGCCVFVPMASPK